MQSYTEYLQQSLLDPDEICYDDYNQYTMGEFISNDNKIIIDEYLHLSEDEYSLFIALTNNSDFIIGKYTAKILCSNKNFITHLAIILNNIPLEYPDMNDDYFYFHPIRTKENIEKKLESVKNGNYLGLISQKLWDNIKHKY
jgi:hypothetical protein